MCGKFRLGLVKNPLDKSFLRFVEREVTLSLRVRDVSEEFTISLEEIKRPKIGGPTFNNLIMKILTRSKPKSEHVC
jgi:hypothetical protein